MILFNNVCSFINKSVNKHLKTFYYNFYSFLEILKHSVRDSPLFLAYFPHFYYS